MLNTAHNSACLAQALSFSTLTVLAVVWWRPWATAVTHVCTLMFVSSVLADPHSPGTLQWIPGVELEGPTWNWVEHLYTLLCAPAVKDLKLDHTPYLTHAV